jgi:pyruvate/2-oxoglutarate dehydrogenase complex dihydrolipoamide dehydrogenase (E3) component
MEVRDMQKYDAIIIGTGQAGPPLAARLVDAGMKVAVIERKSFGGTCVNTGCIPTKTLIASAYAAKVARRATDFGDRLGGGTDCGHEGGQGSQGRDIQTIENGRRELDEGPEILHCLRGSRAFPIPA